MKIAVHAKELEAGRIDGTRNYIAAVLREWSSLPEMRDHEIILYHGQGDFNPAFDVPLGGPISERRLPDTPLWTQTQLAWALWRDQPDVVWIPMHTMPMLHRPSLRVVSTIHDLAFKTYPETFPWKDQFFHNLQTDYVVRHADHLITVSEATQDDVSKYYEDVTTPMTTVHHGIDISAWNTNMTKELAALERYNITSPYMIHIGGIQPRKNLERLIRAFEIVRETQDDLQLVLVGQDAWLAESIHHTAQQSRFASDIIMTGGVGAEDLVALLQSAEMMVYPSLYDGFGMTVLEAFAARTPVVCAQNSSLTEVAGDAAILVDAESVESIAAGIEQALRPEVADRLRAAGYERVQKFSWEKTARETCDALTAAARS